MAFAGKVLIIVQNLPVPFDRRVWLEATTLQQAGYQVAVICPKGQHGTYQESYLCREDVYIYRYPAPPDAERTLGYLFEFVYCWIMTAWLSLRVYRRHGFDVLHACNPPETYFLLALCYKLLGVKFVFDHHDLSPEMYLAKGGKRNGALYRGLLWLEKLTFKSADVVITTNESHKAIAMQRGGVSEDRIFVVRSGPDFERLQVLPLEPALKDGFRYLVCYLGEMCVQDGVEIILEVARLLRDEFGRNDVKFVLMGGGPDLKRLQRLNHEMGLESFVEFTGRVSDHDLCRYLSSADVCLDPDPYSEWSNQSTMNKIMEYMAFGKPTVAFDLKENRYSAQHAALYAAPGDVNGFVTILHELINDEALRQEMADYGRKRVLNRLAWHHSRPKLLAAYQCI
ncbi:MAG: glycosyltransferase family 4 protein [Anaerolineae bacterium]|nr:glycosyltransferase family 4 protein [Anaerolineae bacterium]